MISNHEIKVEIINDGGISTSNIMATKNKVESSAISEMSIHKSINEPYGNFSITLSPKFYDEDFIDEVKPNSMVDIYIDDNMVFQGIIQRPTVTGQLSSASNSAKRSVVLRGFDYGYLFQHVNKAYGQFTDRFMGSEAEANIKLESIFLKERDVKSQVPYTYRVLMNAFKKINDDKEYVFADGKKISDKFGNSGEKVFLMPSSSKDFFVNAPISIQHLQENMSILDYIKRIIDETFSDVFGEILNKGDKVSLGKEGIIFNGDSQYVLIVRPKMFGKYWDGNIKVNIDKTYYQFSAMKDATSIYNYFVVGNAGWDQSANVGEATGRIIKHTNSIKKYGYRPFKANILSTWGSKNTIGEWKESNIISLLIDLTKELSSWYKDSENFISGQLSGPYNKEVKLGKVAVFSLPKSDVKYEGYIEQVDINANAQQSRLWEVITYTRGRKK